MSPDNKDLFAPPTQAEKDALFNAPPSAAELAALEGKKPAEAPGMIESLARGAEQGATFGFGDELNALLSSMASGKSYREELADARSKFKAAEEANPTTSIVGNLVGGFAPGLLSGGAALLPAAGKMGLKAAAIQGAKMGAGYGALAGLGGSEADLSKGEIAQTASDVTKGALGGAALGGLISGGIEAAMPVLGRIAAPTTAVTKDVGADISSSPTLQNIKEAYKAGYGNPAEGVEGVSYVGRRGAERATKELQGIAKGFEERVQPELDRLGQYQSELQKSSEIAPEAAVNWVKGVADYTKSLNEKFGHSPEYQKDMNGINERIQQFFNVHPKPSVEDVELFRKELNELVLTRNPDGSEAAPIIKNTRVADFVRQITGKDTAGVTSEFKPEGFRTLYDLSEEAAPGLKALNKQISNLLKAKGLGTEVTDFKNAAGISIPSAERRLKMQEDINLLPMNMREQAIDELNKGFTASELMRQITKPGLGETLKHTTLAQTTVGTATAAANVLGKVAGAANRSVRNALHELTPDALVQLGQKISTSVAPKAKELGSLLNQVAQADIRKRQALLFAIQQNPEYRGLLRDNSDVETIPKQR